MFWSKMFKMSKLFQCNFHFILHLKKSLYIAWASFRNGLRQLDNGCHQTGHVYISCNVIRSGESASGMSARGTPHTRFQQCTPKTHFMSHVEHFGHYFVLHKFLLNSDLFEIGLLVRPFYGSRGPLPAYCQYGQVTQD